MGDSVQEGNVLRGIVTLRDTFIKKLKGASFIFLEHMMVDKSDGASETHIAGSTAPTPREWISERKPSGLHVTTFVVENKRFENSISVDIPSLERDKIGYHQRAIGGLAIRMGNYPLRLLSDLRLNGGTGLCWDGATYYSTTHVWRDSGSNSNSISQTGVTEANVRTDYYRAREKRILWKDDQGEVEDGVAERLKPVIVHGLATVAVMDLVFNTEKLSTGGNNPTYQKAVTRVDPRITGNGFCFEDLGDEVKPFGLQEEVPVRLNNTKYDGEEAFDTGRIKFGTEWRGRGYYGEPSMSILVGALT